MRGPIGNETPLSLSEVEHGFEHGILDSLPVRRTHKPIGAWELANISMMAKATPFDGLLA